MSSELLYRMVVVRLSSEETDDYADNFLWIAEAGSSNCYESRTGRRARSWQCLAIGHHYSVVKKVCEFAGSCEGGMVKYPGGRDCTPEKFIRAYRSAEAKAFNGFGEAAAAGIKIDLRIRFSNSDEFPMSRHGRYHYAELVKAGKVATDESVGFGDGTVQVFRFDAGDKSDVKLWLSHCHDSAWDCCEVHGPRDAIAQEASADA